MQSPDVDSLTREQGTEEETRMSNDAVWLESANEPHTLFAAWQSSHPSPADPCSPVSEVNTIMPL